MTTQSQIINDQQRRIKALEALLKLDIAETNLCLQWFNAIQDLNPAYLCRSDCILAKKLHEAMGARVPQSILERV